VFYLVILMVLVVLAAGLAARATRAGVGPSNDSLVYPSAASHLGNVRGFCVSPCLSDEAAGSDIDGEEGTPLTHFPPLSQTGLAALRILGLEPREAARWLHVSLFSLKVAIIGLMLLGQCRSAVLALAAVLWIMLSADLRHLHRMAWSEPLCLALGFGGLAVLGRWLEGRESRQTGLLIAAALTGLAAVTRYVGLVYVGVGTLGLIAIRWGPRQRRARMSLLFLGLACLPLILVLVQNLANTGRVFNRQIVFHSHGRVHLRQAVEAVHSWIAPENLPLLMRVVLGAGLATVLAALYIANRIDRTDSDRSNDRESRLLPLEWLLAAFIPSYALCLLVSTSFFDQWIPSNFRLLAPVQMALIPLAALAAERLSTNLRSPRALRAVALVVLVSVLAVRMVAVMRLAPQAGDRGLEFTSIDRSSPLLGRRLRAERPGDDASTSFRNSELSNTLMLGSSG
jgi:hypothetical protein